MVNGFPDAEIYQETGTTLKNPIIFAGFVGAGLVGTISVDYIINKLDMKEIGVKHGMDPDMANKKWRSNFPTPFIHTNWPIIAFLIILLVANIAFNFVIDPSQDKNACFTLFQHIVTLAISGCLGIAWSAFIRSTNTPELQYFSKYKNNENCKKASSKEFRCKIYKNGQEVGETSGDNIFTVQE